MAKSSAARQKKRRAKITGERIYQQQQSVHEQRKKMKALLKKTGRYHA